MEKLKKSIWYIVDISDPEKENYNPDHYREAYV